MDFPHWPWRPTQLSPTCSSGRRATRKARSSIAHFFARLALTGALTAGAALAAFAWEFYAHGDVAAARNGAFSTLVVAELLRSFGARSNVRTVWEVGLFSNLRLVLVVVASFILQFAIYRFAPLEMLFATGPVPIARFAAWFALGVIPLAVLETIKTISRRRGIAA